jgi:hypothetical protein
MYVVAGAGSNTRYAVDKDTHARGGREGGGGVLRRRENSGGEEGRGREARGREKDRGKNEECDEVRRERY